MKLTMVNSPLQIVATDTTPDAPNRASTPETPEPSSIKIPGGEVMIASQHEITTHEPLNDRESANTESKTPNAEATASVNGIKVTPL